MSLLLLYGEEELELGREFLLAVEPIGEVNSSDPTVGVDLHAKGFYVVGAVGSASEVREVELDLVPSLVQSHWHSTDEGLYSCRRLVVGGPEAPTHVLVVQHLHLESEVLFELN